MKGMIFEIERFSIHNGPGIRTTIFLKGCPFRCPWCHNPEGQFPGRDIIFIREKCINCGRCKRLNHELENVSAEERRKLINNPTGLEPIRQYATLCPTNALDIIGEEVSGNELLDVILRDKPFYDISGGGVTLSGGEPYYQDKFVTKLLKRISEHDIHAAVETCLGLSWDKIEKTLKYVNLMIVDIKPLPASQYSKLIGGNKELPLQNLREVLQRNVKTTIRFVIVPKFTDNVQTILADVDYITNGLGRSALSNIGGIEIMQYHTLGIKKYKWLGLKYPLGNIPSPSYKELKNISASIKKFLSNQGLKSIPVTIKKIK
ncbi:MAG: glycyl-radical enzyme activating protein [Candidatus Marinimicrobia bacterium]|nr:glycyl-radical enzyme activating protein [Candidatus Neomarinimicrobiota bacterium]